MLVRLTILANQLDQMGLYKEANAIDLLAKLARIMPLFEIKRLTQIPGHYEIIAPLENLSRDEEYGRGSFIEVDEPGSNRHDQIQKLHKEQQEDAEDEQMSHMLRTLDDDDKANLAFNKTTSPKMLALLSIEDNPFIRQHVARNPNTAIDILRTLAKDEEEDVREAVARNKNTPLEVLRTFAEGPIDYAFGAAMYNPNMLPELARSMQTKLDALDRVLKERHDREMYGDEYEKWQDQGSGYDESI